jgi:lambda family phage portal protein
MTDTSDAAYQMALRDSMQKAGNGRDLVVAKPRAKRRARTINQPSREIAARMYHSAKASRLTGNFATSNSSADFELNSSLRDMRGRSRQLVRDSSFAKRAKIIVQNNIIGSGIGMQAQVSTTRGELNDRVNDAIEDGWCEWGCAEYCHTGGGLHFADMERLFMGQVFEAGEIFIRKHYTAFGGSKVPFALEIIEPERIADESLAQLQPQVAGAIIRNGIEQDRFGRPVAYYVRLRHPGDFFYSVNERDKIERIPAEQIMHLRIIDRWPQTRGEPWMHAAIRKLNDMDGYSEAEIVAARGGANYMASLKTTSSATAIAQLQPGDTSGQRQLELEPGTVMQLLPGEELDWHAPNRPNTAIEPFMRYMLREMAAGVGCSYESLSRDYSQSNYSSSRLALLDDRDLWRMIQGWFIRNCRLPLHKEFLKQAVLAGAIPEISLMQYALDSSKFEKVLFKPRGWGWIDPTKEVEAYKEAVKAGFTTVTDVIAATGGGQDIEDVLATRRRELKMMDPESKETGQMKLVFDTSPEIYTAEATKANAAGKKPDDGEAEAQTDASPPKPSRSGGSVVPLR